MSGLQVATDLALGGRWTSLRAGEREWLWRNPAVSLADRAAARPGHAFVDAGGGEECFPSVNGDPAQGHDHGDVWCRPWVGEPADAAARTREGLTLRRRLADSDGLVRADYDITGPPGAAFIHAVHLLLDVSESARLVVTGDPVVVIPRKGGVGAERARWPWAAGTQFDLLGPDDGTATGAIVVTQTVEIVDGAHRLRLRWGADPAVPSGLMIWRNLGGWPASEPYRSIGIEPMVGLTDRLAGADPTEVAVVGESGTVSWWLEVSAPG